MKPDTSFDVGHVDIDVLRMSSIECTTQVGFHECGSFISRGGGQLRLNEGMSEWEPRLKALEGPTTEERLGVVSHMILVRVDSSRTLDDRTMPATGRSPSGYG